MVNLSLFSQVISKLDRQKFSQLVSKHQTDKHQKGYNSWTHLVSMLFCQFAKSQSVRDISNGFSHGWCYHQPYYMWFVITQTTAGNEQDSTRQF